MLLKTIPLKNKKIIFWTMTVLISAFFILSGYLEITKNPATYPKTIKMGYPPYFISMLGIAKLIGSTVLLIPPFRRLREWVFAAFTFDVIFAFISGYMIQSYADCVKATIVLIVLLSAYFLLFNIDKSECY
ncbi:MAG: DoxX family protein [Flavobacterium sp.]|uniref:DoxX family protein n=1 Tax=Flavobacterium sp. TaxID=239 RepID=UPI003265A72E